MYSYVQLILVSLLLSVCQATGAADLLSITDSPDFHTSGEGIWGPTADAMVKQFRVDVIDIAGSPTLGDIYHGNVVGTTAQREGDLSVGCGTGTFFDVATGACYSCPGGYNHDPLRSANDPGACFKLGDELRSANLHAPATFLCPTSQFPDTLFSACYSCPIGYSHNVALPVNQPGVCYLNQTQRGTQTKQIGCTGSGEFDGLNGSCYRCSSGYSHNWALLYNVSGVCYTNGWLENDTMHYCGKRWWDSCDTKILGICFGGWDYSTGSCSSDNIRSGNKYYDCNSGFTHNIFYSFNSNGICQKWHNGSIATANYAHSFWCTDGDQNGLDGFCYSCPSGYTNVAGICTRTDFATATYQDDITFVCPVGQFYDALTGKCASCDSGFAHNPAFSAQVPGVCFEKEQIVADYEGNSEFGCPAGSFFDAISAACYSCPADYNWNPLAPVDSQGVCYKLEFGPDTASGNFRLGYEMNLDYRVRLGIEGGITLDPGSVTVDYRPTVAVTAERLADSSGVDLVVIHTAQVVADSSLDMSTTWPQIVMYLDSYLDAATTVTSRMVYPKLNDQGIPQQIDKTVTILSEATAGEETIADDPIVEMSFGIHGLEVFLVGDKVVDFEPRFDPPIEFKATVIADPDTLISLGYVIFEVGLVAPDMRIPVEPDYVGDAGNESSIKPTASGTFAHSYIRPLNRSGFNFLQMGGTAQDMDFGRVDIDVDGMYAVTTGEPLGVKVVQGLGIPGLNLWQVNGSILDLDLAMIFSFREDFKFEPNLAVLLTFNQLTKVESSPGSGEFLPVTEKWVKVGDSIKLLHPGGELHVNTSYSVRSNLFTNDTDLVMTPLFAGEVLSLAVKILGMPPQLPSKVTAVALERELSPSPIKLADMNFTGTNDVTSYSLEEFDDQMGGSLVIMGLNEPPVAVCRQGVIVELGNGEDILDDSGVVVGTTLLDQVLVDGSDLNGGSWDPDWGPGRIPSDPDVVLTDQELDSLTFQLVPNLFNCGSLGEQHVTLTVLDPSGASDSCAELISVVDKNDPVISMISPVSGVEGEPLAFSGAGSTDGCGSVTFNWSFSDSSLGATLPAVDHAFCDEGTYTASLTVMDPSGNSSSRQHVVNISNSAPTVTLGLVPQSVDEGSKLQVAADYSDKGSDSQIAAIDWGDGSSENVPTISESDGSACGIKGSLAADHIYRDNGSFDLSVTINDGLVSSSSLQAITVLNVAPAVLLTDPGSVQEGIPVVLTAAFTDPGAADTHTIRWDFGDGSIRTGDADSMLTVTHQYADNGPRVITVTVTDDDGGVGSASVSVNVENVEPLVSAGGDQATDEGAEMTVTGSFLDPGADTHSYIIDWGDGSSKAATLVASHVYKDNGSYTVTVTVTDDDGGVGSDTLNVNVANVAPVLNSLAEVNIFSGGSVKVTTSFTDAGVLDTHVAEIDWGDTRRDSMTVLESNGSGSVAAERVYLELGSFSVKLTLTDKDGAVTETGFNVMVNRLPVLIDIKPGSGENSINLKSNGVIPVAILTTPHGGSGYELFVALDTDVSSLQFGPGMAPIAHSAGHVEDVNGDGLPDLVVHFRTRETGLTLSSTGTGLVGKTSDGRYIIGADLIRLVPDKSADSEPEQSTPGADEPPPAANSSNKAKGKGKS